MAEGDDGGRVRAIAWYLPQFHPIPENDRWWGAGFTEWRNVVRGAPWFDGHEQPQLPADLGFYDLRVPETRAAQAAMARAHGIDGFCLHYYWFGGKRLLERPLEDMLASGVPDFPFCLSWANENWTRRWDGSEDDLLIAQDHSDDDDRAILRSLLPAFRDPRYIRVDGKPLFLVYRTDILPDPARTAAIWRAEAAAAGLPGLHLARVETFATFDASIDPRAIGFDVAVEFPPHAIWRDSHPIYAETISPREGFAGQIFDYRKVAANSIDRPTPDYPLMRGIMPAWDNTARKRERAMIFAHATPRDYQAWLTCLARWTRRHRRGDERLIFVNAWNEWAEGCHLEPDLRHGHAFLDAHRRAMDTDPDQAEADAAVIARLRAAAMAPPSPEPGPIAPAPVETEPDPALAPVPAAPDLGAPDLGAPDLGAPDLGAVTLAQFMAHWLGDPGRPGRAWRGPVFHLARILWRLVRPRSEPRP